MNWVQGCWCGAMCASIANARALLRTGRAGVGARVALVSEGMVLSVGARFMWDASRVGTVAEFVCYSMIIVYSSHFGSA